LSDMNSEGFLEAIEKESEIEITAVGRKSGRPHTNPIWFVQEQNKIYLLPVSGSKSQWFKNLQARPRIILTSGKNKIEVEARPHTDKNFVETVKKKFEEKYGKGEVKKYYSEFDAAVDVTIP